MDGGDIDDFGLSFNFKMISVTVMMIMGGRVSEYTKERRLWGQERERTYASSNKLQKTPHCSLVCLVRYVHYL